MARDTRGCPSCVPRPGIHAAADTRVPSADAPVASREVGKEPPGSGNCCPSVSPLYKLELQLSAPSSLPLWRQQLSRLAKVGCGVWGLLFPAACWPTQIQHIPVNKRQNQTGMILLILGNSRGGGNNCPYSLCVDK